MLSRDLHESSFRISDIRRLGKEIQVDVVHQGQKLIVEIFEDRILNIGDEVSLEFPQSALHYIVS